jgi:hypothetical protein
VTALGVVAFPPALTFVACLSLGTGIASSAILARSRREGAGGEVAAKPRDKSAIALMRAGSGR